MNSLTDILLAPHHKDALIADVAQLLDTHISQRGGLKGMAMKAGLGLLKRARPDILERATRRFLPEMLAAIEPLHSEFRRSSVGDFSVFLGARASETAEKFLAVADARIAASQNPTAKSAYQKFRGGAAEDVESLVPKLGKLFAAYF